MKVYVVTDGNYSDYEVVGIFVDKDKANNYCELHTSLDGNVEEWDTMDEDYKIEKPNMFKYYYVELTTQGEVKQCEELIYKQLKSMDDIDTTLYETFFGTFCCNVIADSEDKAIKITRDKRIQFLADKYGI